MDTPAVTVVTPLGCVVLDGGLAARQLCNDLGITMDSIFVVGPVMVSFTTAHTVHTVVPAAALQDCYVSAGGYIAHAQHVNWVGVARISNVWRARDRYVLGCEGTGLVELRPGLLFQVCPFESVDVTSVSVLELFNYNYPGDYQFIMRPSVQFLRELRACCTHCLRSDGWVIADVRQCALSRFLSIWTLGPNT
uniref:Uncharacterized protein n=1 Tax=Rousettus bat poxvirus TaxID=3141933 RepID=A0AAU7E1W0_9POXV